MAYLKPPAFTRVVFNRIAMRFGIGGSSTLVVPGRTTGVPQRIPVIPVDVGGTRYVVSTRGESDWVRNVRAGGRVTLEINGGRAAYAATEVPIDERAPILDAYRAKAGRTVTGYFAKLPDAADHPVFALHPS